MKSEILREQNLNEKYLTRQAKVLDEAKIISKEPINKGWSSDEKYCITLDDGNKYFLRIIPREKTASAQKCFTWKKR